MIILAAFSMILTVQNPFLGGTANPPRRQQSPAANKPLAPISKEVNFSVERNVAPSPKIRFQVNVKNVRQIPIQIYRLNSSDLVRQFEPRLAPPATVGRPVLSFLLDVSGTAPSRTAPQDSYFQRQFNLPNISPGYYLIQSPGFKGQSWATFNVTNLSVVFKRGEKHALAWITDAKSGRTIPGAEITAFRKYKKIASATTDGKGIANLAIPPGQDVVLVQRGSDLAAIYSYGNSRDGTIVSHMQFDRPVYRPGQKGEFKAILRRIKGLAYAPIANKPITMEFLDPQSTLLERHELTTTSLGTVAGSFDIPREGALGGYTVRLVKGDEYYAVESFQVAEYRKPEFKATSTFSQKRYLSGEKINFKLATEYYFGAKVPGAQVQIVVRRSPMNWDINRFEFNDGNLYSRNTFSANEVVSQDVRTTSADGTLDYELKSTTGLADANYDFTCTITDGSSRQISHSNSVPVYAASVRVSAVSTVGYVPLGHLIPISVRLSNLDNQPVGGTVDLELRKRVWNSKEKREIEITTEKTTVIVPATGKATASMPAKSEGYLILLATSTDGTGRKTTSRSDIYVADPFSTPASQKAPPMTGIRLEKRMYTVGDTVNGFVESNRPGHPILLTMEGADLLSYKVLDKPGPISFKLDLATCPNMNFDVNQWVEGNRTSGSAMIIVDDPTRRISVELKPDKTEFSPGDKAHYSVTTKNSAGKPVSAEIGLQVIDDAIYAIQPDHTPKLFDSFYGRRSNGVVTQASAPREMSGGAYQRNEMQSGMAFAMGGTFVGGKSASMRTQFVDTAYWNAFVQTDENGQANVEFEMPGNLTAWRAQARAITATTQVGEGEAMTRSSRPLTLRLATPRQMAVGDQLKIIATVTNRNAQDEKVRIRVQVGDKVTEESIVAPAKGDARIQVPIEAVQMGTLAVVGELIDSSGTRLDGLEVKVPVNPNGVPFKVVTTGITADGHLSVSLPENRIPDSESVKIRFLSSPSAQVGRIEKDLLDMGRYSPVIAAEQIEVAARMQIPWTDDRIREPIAMLGRTRQSAGWGWWDQGTPNPIITARVLRGLTATKNYPEWQSLRQAAKEAAEHQYGAVQFAEFRAFIVESLAIAGSQKAAAWTLETDETKTPMSPTAQLALSHALFLTGHPDRAKARLSRLTALVSRGTSSYLPVGNGVGWAGSQLEANARLLQLTCEFDPGSNLIDSLVEWVSDHVSQGGGPGDTIAAVNALRRYSDLRKSPTQIGILKVQVGGADIPVNRQPDGLWAEVILPRQSEGKPITVASIDPSHPIRYVVEARAFKKALVESRGGIRTLFRWEVLNEAGAWEELNRPLKRNEAIRATSVVWGDSVSDAVKVTLPIPAGFEFVDSDRFTNGRQEVRDGAVIYYTILSDGRPSSFRFYLRSETDGTISVPAAMAEALRRPESRGNSDALHIVISGGQ